MEIIEEHTAPYLLQAALRAADKRRKALIPVIAGELLLYCGLVIDELWKRDAVIKALPAVVKFPTPQRKKPEPYLVEAGQAPHVSTPELRRHAFAVYALTMAYHGPEEAFEAAVYETLRRTRGWTLTTAQEHTRRFVLPAWDRAFPSKRQ